MQRILIYADIPCMVGGGATLVSNTRVGRTFAKKVVATIEQQYDLSNVTNWVIDQVALRRGILEVERRHGSLATVKAFRRVGSPMIFANAYHSKEAFVESMGGKKA